MWAWHPHGWGRSLLVGIGAPAVVTGLAALEAEVPKTTAAVLYVLAVVVSSALGGAAAGALASLISFLALNFFFTPPVHTLIVERPQDLLALVAFLTVSVVTGLLLASVLHQKARAERREVQTRLLNRFTGQVLSGKPLEDVLHELGESLVDVLELNYCEFDTVLTSPVRVGSNSASASEELLEIPLSSKGREVGSMRVGISTTRGPLGHADVTVLEGFAGQLALALESIRLSEEVNRIQLEAEAERLRVALFSGVTHDLKTPLAAITASVTSLLDEAEIAGEARRDHLDTIRQEADHLNRVVSNLLDFGRLRAGVLTPSKQPAAMDELIEAVATRLRPLLRDRHLQIDIKGVVPEIPLDLIQIEQVLTNLIENAVKFSPPASPITVSVVAAPAWVRVSIANKGAGISKLDRDRLFQPFERGEERAAGTGLGLAVARALISAHGGRIWAQETPGGGATLTFELPLEDVPEEVHEQSGSGRR